MKRFILTALLATAPVSATSQNAIIDDIVNAHIVPRFQALANTSANLGAAAQTDCTVTSPALQAAYAQAFDAWISASHLRFGPSEIDDRAFALAFWPDSRGATPRSLTALLSAQDPVIASPQDYAQVSIAARGFYAMEFLIYDEMLRTTGLAADRCNLIQTVATDIASTSAAILSDWQSGYAAQMINPDPNGLYRSDEDAVQTLFDALTTGLQFTSETRLGRPLGTFERPRPTRAEAWRSARSARHARLSLAALDDLTQRLSGDDPDLAAQLRASFARSRQLLADLDDPAFAGVAAAQTRFKIEVIEQSIDLTRAVIRDRLGPTLGVAAGFNALDGD